MAASSNDLTTVSVKRPLLDDLRRAQAVMGAEAGRPITLGDCLRRLLDYWRASGAEARRS